MLRLVVDNGGSVPPPPPPKAHERCPHGYAMAGNCKQCFKPPSYSPLTGQRTR